MLLILGTSFFWSPTASADGTWQATNGLVSGNTVQFDYRGGSATYVGSVTDGSTITVVVNNTIANCIGTCNPIPDEWTVSINGQSYSGNAIEIRTLTAQVSGQLIISATGRDIGFWGGWYGPIITVSISSPTPTPSDNASPSPSPEPSVSPSPEPSPTPEPTPTSTSVVSETQTATPAPETSTVTADTVTATPMPSPSTIESLTPSETSTVIIDTVTVVVEPTPQEPAPVILPSPEPVLEPEPTPAPQPTSQPEPAPTPAPQPSAPPVVVADPAPVVDVVPEPAPEPVPVAEPAPEPAPEPVVEEPPAPAEEPPVVNEEPSSPLPPEPEPPADAPEPVEDASPEPNPPVEEPVSHDEPPVVEQQYTPQVVVLTANTNLQELPPQTPVELPNGVVVTAEVAIAVEVLQNPSELLAMALTNPVAALEVLSNVGADLPPEVREKAEDVIVSAVIAGNIATQAAASAAGAAAYRRKP